ncbi:MAG: hypothetical protein ACKN85_05310 [Pirellula sp.]
MSTANSKSNEKKRASRPGRKLRIFSYLMGLFIGLLLVVPMCRTTGIEFSPVRFQSREFTLYRIPGTNLSFLPTFYSNPTSIHAAPEILGHLQTFSQYEIWHTAGSNSYGGDSFPAKLLLDAIQRKNAEADPYWGVWSLKNPKRASILWPIIQSMAMANLYHEIPETLRFAEGIQAPDDQFQKALLTEIHAIVQKRQALFPTTNPPPKNLDTTSEGIPDWSDVQAWLQKNPIPLE